MSSGSMLRMVSATAVDKLNSVTLMAPPTPSRPPRVKMRATVLVTYWAVWFLAQVKRSVSGPTA